MSAADRISRLKDEIFELHRLREAQAAGDPHYSRYQARITELTGRLLHYQEHGEEIDSLRRLVAARSRELGEALAARDGDDNPFRLFAGVFGLVLAGVFGGWLWRGGPLLGWSAGVVALLTAGCVVAMVAYRRDGAERSVGLREELSGLRARLSVIDPEAGRDAPTRLDVSEDSAPGDGPDNVRDIAGWTPRR